MPTVVAKKKPARKASVRVSRPLAKSPALRAVDENGRFILGYAEGFVRVRPGADLTKPTLPPGNYFE
ncbi:MAG: hypothetical protein H7067_12075 [Burkholderiales bacterium]|nr:hypothetical protein [Opitutaceae bacterium]